MNQATGRGPALHPTEVFEEEIEALDRYTVRSWSSWLAGAGAFVVLAGFSVLVISYATRAYLVPDATGGVLTITLEEPAGAIPHLPAQFRWAGFAGAASYLVTVLDADSQAVVLSKPTRRTTLAPSAQELAPFHPGRYRWTVEARKENGTAFALGEGSFELSAPSE